PASPNLTPRLNPHRARGTDGAPTSRDFVPRRFSDVGRPSMWRPPHCRRPKTCTEAEFAGPVDLEAFTAISDPHDRKFAALSAAVNVPLITNDGRVLAEGGAAGIEALTPRVFLERKGESG